jgi:hypothetical protein
MAKYYVFFIVLFVMINFGYGFSRISRMRDDVVSVPVIMTSALICIGGVVWIRAIYRKKKW